MKKLPRIRIRPLSVLKYSGLAVGMVLCNFALPFREPLAFALCYAALANAFDPFLTCGAYLLSSVTALSLEATLSAAVQAAFLLLVCVLYRRLGRPIGLERLLYAAAAQLPFIFLFPHEGYTILPLSPILTKLILAAAILLLSVLFEGALSALLDRAFRMRLGAADLTELALLWLIAGMGILSAVGEEIFYAIALTLLLGSVVLLKSAASVPFSAVLSLPLCIFLRSALPLSEFVIYASAALLLIPYGKNAAALALFTAYAAALFFQGVYALGVVPVILSLAACLLPVILFVCIPEGTLRRFDKTLLFYRERTLPRIAVNRSRRAVGEQLYEISSLFRDIALAFRMQDRPSVTAEQLRNKVISELCTACPNRQICDSYHLHDGLDKLIAVGRAKGHVNLIDLPSDLSARCINSAGLLFAVNTHLAEYARIDLELETAREGRRLLAEQAQGVSEVLKNIALEQSEEYVFSDEERRLSAALSKEGLLSFEIFLYGEGENFTVTLTLDAETSGKAVCRIAERALGVRLTLSEKLPLTQDRACFILRKKPIYDASFGVASKTKEGELACGDTHSILKIDERRFIAALSDGMGSGEEARAVSDRTLSLLESFYKAKMPSDTVLATVNRLVAYSTEESFSCIDLAAVNLDTGVADIVKIGSPAGFVLSGETLQVLEGESLPIGVLDTIHPACLRVELKADDFLIFMSDGISSAFGSSSDLCAYLSRLHPLNPQALAEEILGTALSRYRGVAEDDMTVVTVKLTAAA